MSDTLTPRQRHAVMAAIRSKDTKPEMVVRRYLWNLGFRYRLNHPRLPGKPDLVLRKYRTCIFVNGCFWHGHHIDLRPEGISTDHKSISDSDCCKIPHTNRGFWIEKIRRNQKRDYEVQQRLASMGWHSITVWECELHPKQRAQTLQSLAYTLHKIFLDDHRIHRYALPEEEESAMAAEPRPE